MVESGSIFAQLFDGIPTAGADYLAPDAITPDIANTPSQYPTLFSRESWEQYCVAKHGPKASVLAGSIFDHIATLDGVDDGYLDINGLKLANVMEVFGFGEMDAVFSKFDTSSDSELTTIKNAIREDLNYLHHNSHMGSYRGELYLTKVGENRFFAVLGDTDYVRMISSVDLNTAWERAQALHPNMEWMRLVTHAGYHVGDTHNELDPDHAMKPIASMQSDLLVTGGVGVVRATSEMSVAPDGQVGDYIDPSVIDSLITGAVGIAYLGFALFSRGKRLMPQLPAFSTGGPSSRINRASTYSKEVLTQLVARLNNAKDSGQRFVTTYMGNAPKEQPSVELSTDPFGVGAVLKVIGRALIPNAKPTDGQGEAEIPTQPPPAETQISYSLATITTVTRDQVKITPTDPRQPIIFAVTHGEQPKGQEVMGDIIYLPNKSVGINHLIVTFNPLNRQLSVKNNPHALGGTQIGYDNQRPTMLLQPDLTVNVSGRVKNLIFRLGTDVEVVVALPPIPRTSPLPIPVVSSPTARDSAVRLSQPLEPVDVRRNPPLDPTRQVRRTVPLAGPITVPKRDTEPQESPPAQVTWAPGIRVAATSARATIPNPMEAELVAVVKTALARIPGVINATSSGLNRTVYAGASSPNGNRVSVTLLPGAGLDVGEMVVRHMAPILTEATLPVPVSVSVKFEPELSFESMCRTNRFSETAIKRAQAGGIVKINIEGQGSKPIDESSDDAAVVTMIRITGRDLARTSGVMKVELTLPQSAARDVATVNAHLNNIKGQLLGKLWSTSHASVPTFLKLFPQVSLEAEQP